MHEGCFKCIQYGVRKEEKMKKKTIIISVVVALVIISSLYFLLRPKSFDKKMESILEDMDSYVLKGDMEINKGENIKVYALHVVYKKEDKQDYFKVSITDKEINQKQEIIRNKEGVFVVTPSLNQIFKFEGNWPLNSLKPYLMQSMVSVMNQENTKTNKKDGKYYVRSDVNYPNNAFYKKQEMIFDEEGKIEAITIEDDNEVMQLNIKFNQVDYNCKVKNKEFEIIKKTDESVYSEIISEEDLPLYPTNVFDSILENFSQMEVNGETRHIMEYKGDKNFTVIESIKSRSEQLETVIMSGQFIDSVDAFGFYDGNHMMLINNGVEYTIYSDDLSLSQMVEVLSSMQMVVMK